MQFTHGFERTDGPAHARFGAARRRPGLAAVFVLAAAPLATAVAGEVTLSPAADTTIFEADPDASNGAGDGVFLGRTSTMGGGAIRRGLIDFDVAASIPAGSRILAVELTMHLTQAGGPPVERPASLHRLLADWGEAGSVSPGGQGAPAEPGDATWTRRFFPDVDWSMPGGDAAAGPSATTLIGFEPAPFTWGPTETLRLDVQAFLDDPGSDHGWLILGDESTAGTSRRMFSREADDDALRPALRVRFAPPDCLADLDGDGSVGAVDLLALLESWGPCPDCPADVDRDGTVGTVDLLALLEQWGACPGG